MRSISFVVVLALTAAALGGATAPADANEGGYPLRAKVAGQGDPRPPVVLRGRGWGHSTGLSQYGAYAQARAGRSSQKILQHYYPGTTLGTGTGRVTVRLFGDGSTRPSVTGAPVKAVGGAIRWRIVAESESVDQPVGSTWTVRSTGGKALELLDAQGVPVFEGEGDLQIRLSSMDTFRSAHSLAYMGNPNGGRRHYAYGRITFRAASGGLHISNRLPMEGYLRGLGEVPSSWGNHGGQAALEAQAIIARTYVLKRGRVICATPACQVFIGYDKETESSGGRWVSAVSGTGDHTLMYGNGFAETVYSSSHGGRTEASEDAWPYGNAFPYLISVDDKWSLDPINPMRSWTTTATHAEFRRVAGGGLSRIERVRILSRTSGGSPTVIRVYGPEGTRDFSTTPKSARSSRTCNRTGYAGNSLRCDLLGTTVRNAAGDLFTAAGGQPPSSQIRSIGFPPFADDDGHVHEYAIVWAHAAGIAQGIDGTTYAPNRSVTRGQMASFIYRTFDIPRKTSSAFTDAQTGPHAEAIASISAAGIAKGYDGKTFGTNDSVTRAQMASFLVRALGLDPVTPNFSDVSKNGIHSGNIGALASSGITAGCTADKYCPRDPVTRGQMATFLHRTARTQ